jgi:hypothetical protein
MDEAGYFHFRDEDDCSEELETFRSVVQEKADGGEKSDGSEKGKYKILESLCWLQI